jgi:YVTN family beta-propeller protein
VAPLALPRPTLSPPDLMVNSTIVLFNNTTFPGNYRPLNFVAPGPIAVDGPDHLLYVGEPKSPGIQVANLTSGEVIYNMSFPATSSITSLAYDSADHLLYAVNSSSGDVLVKKTTGNRSVLASIALTGSGTAQQVEYDPTSGVILATESSPNNLVILNATNYTIVSTYGVGSSPQHAARAGAGGPVYVANSGSATVTVVNTTTGVRWTKSVGTTPWGVAYDADGKTVWVTNEGSNNATLIDVSANTTSSVLTGGGPLGVAYDPASDLVLVALPDYGTTSNVSVFNGSTAGFVRNETLHVNPGDLALVPGNNSVVVSPYNSGFDTYALPILNATGHYLQSVYVGAQPIFAAWLPNRDSILLEDSSVNRGFLLNGTSRGVEGHPSVGEYALDSAYSAQTGDLYIAGGFASSVDVVNATTAALVTQIGTKYGATSIAYDPGTRRLFVGDELAGDIDVVDTSSNRVIANLSLGIPYYQAGLGGLAVDPVTEQLYAAEYANASVAVFNTTTLRAVATFSYPGTPGYATYDAGLGAVIIAGPGGVETVNPSNYSATRGVALGANASAYDLLYSPTTGDVYLANPGNHSVLVVNPVTGRLLPNITLVDSDDSIALDSRTGLLYAPEVNRGEVAIVPTSNRTPPWVRAFRATPSNPVVNQSLNLSAQVVGGSTPLNFTYFGLPTGCRSRNQSWLNCTPTISGNRTVRLVVRDTTGLETNATVSFSIDPGPEVRLLAFTASRNPVDVNASTVIHADASVRYGNLSYVYTGLPPGCSSSNSSTLTCTPSATGSFPITVRVMGLLNSSASGNLTVTVDPRPGLDSFSVAPTVGEVGAPLTLRLTVSGGAAPFQVLYGGLPGGCSSSSAVNYTCLPTAAGNTTVSAVVTDASGVNVTGSVQVQVVPRLAVASFEANPSLLDLGGSSTFRATASGGVGPPTFAYTSLPTGCASANVSQLVCRPAATGSFVVNLSVNDLLGVRVRANATLRVVAALVVGSFAVSPDRIELGGSTLFLLTISGGAAPVSLSYAGLPPGCSSRNSPTLPCSPASVGRYAIRVTAEDAAGTLASGNVSLEVAPSGTLAPRISSFGATPSNVTVGTPFTLQVRMGSNYPFTFSYSGLPAGCLSANSSSITCTAQSTGTYRPQVNASSLWGSSTTANTTVEVVANTSTSHPGPPSARGSSPLLEELAAAMVIAALALVGLALWSRRRRQPPSLREPGAEPADPEAEEPIDVPSSEPVDDSLSGEPE